MENDPNQTTEPLDGKVEKITFCQEYTKIKEKPVFIRLTVEFDRKELWAKITELNPHSHDKGIVTHTTTIPTPSGTDGTATLFEQTL